MSDARQIELAVVTISDYRQALAGEAALME
jgi:hypothetical protein